MADDTQRAAAAVVAAAREAVAKFCEGNTPILKTDDLLPHPYWSPAGRMMDTKPMMALRDALAAYDAARAGEDGDG